MELKIPESIYPFVFHGVDFTGKSGSQLVGVCPFSGRRDKFYVDPDSGQWSSKTAFDDEGRTLSGNLPTFLLRIWEHHRAETTKDQLKSLARDRGLPWTQLRRFGLAWDAAGSRWLLPVFSRTGKSLMDIRWYRPGSFVGSTRGVSDALQGLCLFNLPKAVNARSPIYVCEGEFDAIAMDYLLRKAEQPGIVVGVPGADVWKTGWADYFLGKDVVLVYDNDQAGDRGSEKAGHALGATARSVKYVAWPEETDSGFDIRDYVTGVADEDDWSEAWGTLEQIIEDTHRRADTGPKVLPRKNKKVSIDKVLATFRKWLGDDKDIEDAVRVICGVVVSNQISGDPLWVFVVAPPGSGKTLILGQLSSLRDCKFVSAITRHTLVSGYQTQGEDPSLIPKLDGKVFVLKDYTEILSMDRQAQNEIYSTLRGAYDGTVERPFGNGLVRSYTSHFSMLAGVTAAIHGNMEASLGERFLKFQMMRDKTSVEDKIRSSVSSVGMEVERNAALSQVLTDFLDRDVEFPKPLTKGMPKRYFERLIALVQLIALLRAEVTRDPYRDTVLYRPEEEVATRLCNQLVKLAVAISASERKPVDRDIYRLVERVALDTAIGFHLDIVQAIFKGAESQTELCKSTGLPLTNLQRHLNDLSLLGIVKHEKGSGRLSGTYRLADKVVSLWRRAKVGQDHSKVEAHVRRKKPGSHSRKRRRRRNTKGAD